MLKTVITYPGLDDEKLIMRANLENTASKVKPVVKFGNYNCAKSCERSLYGRKIESYILDIIIPDFQKI